MDVQLSGKQRAMIEALKLTHGEVSSACRAVRISRQTHYNWLDYPAYEKAVNLYELNSSAIKAAVMLDQTQDKDINGYVYLVHCVGTDLYKIGRSKLNYSARLSSLQTGCPYELSMIHAVHCDAYGRLEKLLHQTFKDKRVRGEWFELSDCEKKSVVSLMQREKQMQTVLNL